jgi:snurportin-1
MLSEWLEDRPIDFESNWLVTVSPVGKRCLVVASEGSTCVYNKAGKLIARHSSRLPGGSKESKLDSTLLDCIYSDPLRTYFVLDCLEWKCHPILDSEVKDYFKQLCC